MNDFLRMCCRERSPNHRSGGFQPPRATRDSGRSTVLLLAVFSLTIGITSIVHAQVILGPNGPHNPEHPRHSGRRPDDPIVRRLTVAPAPEPDPPLRYTLYPRWTELQPGNSVPMWYRALEITSQYHPAMQKYSESREAWSPENWREMPVAEVREFVQSIRPFLDNARIASRREQTDWQLALRDLRGSDVITVNLDEFQRARWLALFLSLRMRLQIMDGDFEAALDDLSICFRLARDVAEPETYINDLIGVAIDAISSENIRHFIGTPGSPNLYWALAVMPKPFIDMQEATEAELSLPERLFPWLKNLGSSNRSAQEWRSFYVQALKDMSSNGTFDMIPGLQNAQLSSLLSASDRFWEVTLFSLCLRSFPTAKADLIADGYDESQLDQMPIGQILALHEEAIYAEATQRIAAATSLPFSHSQPRLAQLYQDLDDRGFIPIVSSLRPGVSHMKEAQIRRESMRAALMNIEAIRMHLVESDGQLPESLDEITVVPVPVDPRTQKPFPYELQGDTAVLDVFARYYHQRFEIKVAEN